MTDTRCHHCDEEAETYPCPRCNLSTCEACFEASTQFNAGSPLSCLSCVDRAESEWRAQSDSDSAAAEAMAVLRKNRSNAAHKRYHSPEAVAARMAKKKQQALSRREQRLKTIADVTDIMAGFKRFF